MCSLWIVNYKHKFIIAINLFFLLLAVFRFILNKLPFYLIYKVPTMLLAFSLCDISKSTFDQLYTMLVGCVLYDVRVVKPSTNQPLSLSAPFPPFSFLYIHPITLLFSTNQPFQWLSAPSPPFSYIIVYISIMVFTYGVFGYRLSCVVLQVVYRVRVLTVVFLLNNLSLCMILKGL